MTGCIYGLKECAHFSYKQNLGGKVDRYVPHPY